MKQNENKKKWTNHSNEKLKKEWKFDMELFLMKFFSNNILNHTSRI